MTIDTQYNYKTEQLIRKRQVQYTYRVREMTLLNFVNWQAAIITPLNRRST